MVFCRGKSGRQRVAASDRAFINRFVEYKSRLCKVLGGLVMKFYSWILDNGPLDNWLFLGTQYTWWVSWVLVKECELMYSCLTHGMHQCGHRKVRVQFVLTSTPFMQHAVVAWNCSPQFCCLGLLTTASCAVFLVQAARYFCMLIDVTKVFMAHILVARSCQNIRDHARSTSQP